MAEHIKLLRPFEGQWEPEREIGAGSFGRVWKAARKKEGEKEYTAIKEILIPGSEEVLREARFEGLDEEGAKLYLEESWIRRRRKRLLWESFQIVLILYAFMNMKSGRGKS